MKPSHFEAAQDRNFCHLKSKMLFENKMILLNPSFWNGQILEEVKRLAQIIWKSAKNLTIPMPASTSCVEGGAVRLFTCCLVSCSESQQYASVSQGQICFDNCACCHTEIEVAEQACYLTQSQLQYTDTETISLSTDTINGRPLAGQPHEHQYLSHWLVRLDQGKWGLIPMSAALQADALALGHRCVHRGKHLSTWAISSNHSDNTSNHIEQFSDQGNYTIHFQSSWSATVCQVYLSYTPDFQQILRNIKGKKHKKRNLSHLPQSEVNLSCRVNGRTTTKTVDLKIALCFGCCWL